MDKTCPALIPPLFNLSMSTQLNSYNPANGEHLGSVAVTDAADIPAIVATSRQASTLWTQIPMEQRIALLEQAGVELVERAEELGELLSREMGKPLQSGINEVRGCGQSMASKARRVAEALAPVDHSSESTITRVSYEPLGVCAVISPWNYPMSMVHWMVVPALVAGNSVILKPSEETPLIAQAYADVLRRYLPENLLQVVHGADEQGKALVAADVNLIVFTGSRATGQRIMASAAGSLKRLILELGGKDPLLVLPDANLEDAARFAVSNSLENSGQMCIATERILVAEEVATIFEQLVIKLAEGYTTGPWNQPGVKLGPMINASQRQIVLEQIRDAVNKGAKVLLGGTEHPDYYIEPTVLTGITDDMLIAREETFGPVICISHYQDLDQAIATANNTPYGLGAVVFGQQQANEVAARFDAGMVGINKSIFGTGDVPWIGAKQSGFGYHGSPDGHRQFARPKVISWPREANP